MAIDPRISLGVQQLQLPDPLAQYGQMQNILAAQSQREAAGTQNELAQTNLAQARMAMRETQEAQDAVRTIMTEAKKNGSPSNDPMETGMQMLGHPNKQVQAVGQHLIDSAQKVLAYQQDKEFANYGRPAQTPVGAASFTPGALGSGTFDPNAPIATQAQRSAASTGANLPPIGAPTNQLAPATISAPTNALAEPSKADQLLAKITDLRTRFPYSSKAKDEIAFLTKQWEEASKTHVVGRNLVRENQSIFTAPQDVTPTELQKYIDERNALAAKNPKDPNIAVYDRQIKDMGLARERLNFDERKFAWEKANPGFTIQQKEDGAIVGVNNRTLQAYPVNLNQTAPPTMVPFGGVSGATVTPGGAGKRGGVVAPAAEPIIQPRGEPLMGKSAGLTESQGNATAFGMRMKDSHAVLKNLESKGETNTGLIRGTVGGTVGLVPFIGDKLAGATDNIFNVLPSILGGMSPEQQQIQNSRINFITAVLRKESGASIAPSEFAMAEKLYFPQPGNDASVIKQKQRARELAIKAMEIQAGSGAKSIQSLTPGASNATSASDPLGLFNK
jgi:hypothetical protein